MGQAPPWRKRLTAMTKGLVGYFGYGSLVNRATLQTAYVAARPARLMGWRRHWQCRKGDLRPGGAEMALLTVHRAPECSILGLLVIDRAQNLAAVDAREYCYDRIPLAPGDLELPDGGADLPDELYVYVAHPAEEPAVPPLLLQSYLDTVMLGFHNEYGDTGVSHFMETTAGFARPIIRDRNKPFYPRTVAPGSDIAARFDALLVGAGVDFGIDKLG